MKNPIIYRILQQGFCLIFCLGLLSSCIREEEFVNNPQGNFEQLWKIIDEQYCFLDYKQIDWDEIHTRYQKLITPNMGSEGLFEVLSEMLYELQDGHVNLASAHNVSYYDAWYQDYPRNFRADLLEDSYLGRASTDYRTAAGLKYKILEDNIGYIRYESFADPVGNGNLDEVLSYLSVCNGLIIDVRDNGGGNATNSARIASRFTNEKILTGYISHKTGIGHNDFSKPYAIYLEPANGVRWQKKVVVLPIAALSVRPMTLSTTCVVCPMSPPSETKPEEVRVCLLLPNCPTDGAYVSLPAPILMRR